MGVVDPQRQGFILVVEDDRSIRELIVDILDDAGYGTAAVALPSQASDFLRDSECRLVVADLNAPYYTSDTRDEVWDLALHELRQPASKPIIVVTAHSGAASEDASERGVAAILLKPFQVDDLLNMVEKVLGDTAAK